MDVTSEDSILPHLVPFGRLPCSVCGQHRAHDVLLLSCWSSCSFNLPALSQFTAPTNSICTTHGKITENELYSPCSGWCKDRLCPADLWLPPPGAFQEHICQWVTGLVPPLLWSWQCAWTQGGKHPLISFSKPAKSRATQHMQMENEKALHREYRAKDLSPTPWQLHTAEQRTAITPPCEWSY